MNDPLFSIADQVVLVSGGTRGIGRALAEGFCERGAIVAITGRDETAAQQAAREIAAARQGRCLGLACDVAEPAQIQPAVDRLLAEHGRIDVLVNVAGVNRRRPAEDLTEADMDFVLNVNFRGAFRLSQAVGRHMLERGRGSQINIGSFSNHGPLHWLLPYAASKAALGHMIKSLAMEWGPRGLRVNGIAPGFIVTDLNRQMWEKPLLQEWGRTNTPLVRTGEPGDLIGAAIFLASAASAYMTGQMLFVDGGLSAGLRWPIEQVMG